VNYDTAWLLHNKIMRAMSERKEAYVLPPALFYWVFQSHPDWILELQPDLAAGASGYRFSAPVLKEREYRLDGLFLPPPQRPDLPAVLARANQTWGSAGADRSCSQRAVIWTGWVWLGSLKAALWL